MQAFMPEPVEGSNDMYDHILIPTDGSVGAERGVDVGLTLAEKFDATVHVLYVVDERVYGETPALSNTELHFERLEEEGEAIVAEITEKAGERGVDTTTIVCRGIPYEEIQRYASENDVDLIVMGLHGVGEHPRPHIGSCTDRVLRSSKTPVFPV
jgi:nucleotide-binding universal stress UspA family protein